ncbi:MAG: MFS transporter [Haliscomenobacteraceae bacterium CHB4]|nr:putative MFS-type transporter YhjX [Saprospiraceae bacterium]MCE7926006.1 MFS transporter [Haliscomenobacteraceae bacterium CHB4]
MHQISAFLHKSNTVASSGFNRWLVPPAALSIHLCIGQIYAYSVFNKPLTQAIGIGEPAAGDWSLVQVGHIFSIALFCLGASAAVFGKWLERAGPRKAMFASALCFSGGFFVSALGVWLHEIWLLYLGHGVLGGIGLGLGYISPVSTLIKWFPDRPGMATGMAIMGFGGGAMLASPLSIQLMDWFRTPHSTGVAETFLVMGGLYFAYMMFGVLTVRVPPADWKPEGWQAPAPGSGSQVAGPDVDAGTAIRTPQFYLLFGVLMLNVTAGIGVLGQASVMIQEMFSERVVGDERAVTAVAAGGFVGLLSLFNMAGRFFWSSLSDKIGRRRTYTIFFLLGAVLYFLIPLTGQMGNIVLFVGAFCVIMSMYGGGFATIPAYLRDMFGTLEVGAIHGRLLLAWSAAALLGPQLVNNIRAYQIETLQVPAANAYSTTMYIMAGLLLIGFVCNISIRPVQEKYHFKG